MQYSIFDSVEKLKEIQPFSMVLVTFFSCVPTA